MHNAHFSILNIHCICPFLLLKIGVTMLLDVTFILICILRLTVSSSVTLVCVVCVVR